MPGKDAFKAKTRGRSSTCTTALDGTAVSASRSPEDLARAARIAELKSQIKNGTYRPNLEKVAERLLPELLADR